MTQEQKDEFHQDMLCDAYEEKANQIADIKHEQMMTSDLDYAIEYINEQYDLISLYESFREANDKLTTYGWQLSIKELFAEM